MFNNKIMFIKVVCSSPDYIGSIVNLDGEVMAIARWDFIATIHKPKQKRCTFKMSTVYFCSSEGECGGVSPSHLNSLFFKDFIQFYSAGSPVSPLLLGSCHH